MNTIAAPRRQTILRFDEQLLDKLKYYARKEDKSLNAYVESVLIADIGRREELPHLQPDTEFSPEIRAITGVLKGRVRQEDIDNDERLAYILSR